MRDNSPTLKSMEPICCSRRARAMLASPELLSSWSSSSASTRASSGRSDGAVGSRPGGTAPGGSSGPSRAPRRPCSRRHGGSRRRWVPSRRRASRWTADRTKAPTRRRAPAARAWVRRAAAAARTRASGAARRESSVPARGARHRRRCGRWRDIGAGGGTAITARAAAHGGLWCRCGGAGTGASCSRRGAGARRGRRQQRRAGPGCASAWIFAMRPWAVGTPLPVLTDSRMRASSSSAVCARPKARSSGATTPLSICMNSVSSSWLRSPMGTRPAMRAPPLSVCSGRFSAARPSTLLRFSFHCASAPCARR